MATHTSAFGVTSLVRLMQPDLILLDINMMALSGDKLASLIRDYCNSSFIPVVFHSCNDESSLLESVTVSGVPGYTLERGPCGSPDENQTGYQQAGKEYREVRAREFIL